jgi:hypothetical protein
MEWEEFMALLIIGILAGIVLVIHYHGIAPWGE